MDCGYLTNPKRLTGELTSCPLWGGPQASNFHNVLKALSQNQHRWYRAMQPPGCQQHCIHLFQQFQVLCFLLGIFSPELWWWIASYLRCFWSLIIGMRKKGITKCRHNFCWWCNLVTALAESLAPKYLSPFRFHAWGLSYPALPSAWAPARWHRRKGNAGTGRFFPGFLLLFLGGKPEKVSLCLDYPSAHKSHVLLLQLKRRKRGDREMQKLFIFPAFCSESNCVRLKWGGASAVCSVPCWCTFPGEIPVKAGFDNWV